MAALRTRRCVPRSVARATSQLEIDNRIGTSGRRQTYLDAEFVSRYLPHVAEGVSIRLLGGPKKRATLLPAVDSFAQQAGRPVAVRVAGGLHDRYLFIDEAVCYLSGASFKDGARNAPAVLTQITDAFDAMWDTYQRRWNDSTLGR